MDEIDFSLTVVHGEQIQQKIVPDTSCASCLVLQANNQELRNDMNGIKQDMQMLKFAQCFDEFREDIAMQVGNCSYRKLCADAKRNASLWTLYKDAIYKIGITPQELQLLEYYYSKSYTSRMDH